jgi:hypothetical protein
MFFFIGASVYIGLLLSGPFAYALMSLNVWLQAIVGLICYALALLLSLCIPGRPNIGHHHLNSPQENEAISPVINDAGHDSQPKQATGLLDRFLADGQLLASAIVQLLWNNRPVALLLLTFLLTTLGRYAQEILLQYVTKRYGWTWSQASLLLSIRAFASLLLLLLILPTASRLLASPKVGRLSARTKDLWLARGSAALLTLGAFTIGLAPKTWLMACGVALYALGGGYNSLVRSLAVGVAGTEHAGTLYTIIATLESMGSLVAGPILSVAFNVGMSWDGAWVGLPFLAAGCLFSITLTVVCCLRMADNKA